MDNTNKPKRKRRKLNIDIDTKNVDIKIVRDEDGKTTYDIDTPRIDVHATRTDDSFEMDIEIDDKKEYEFESNGTASSLPKGTIWRITGEMLRVFLKMKFGKLFNKKNKKK
jgi:hypothetical protein